MVKCLTWIVTDDGANTADSTDTACRQLIVDQNSGVLPDTFKWWFAETPHATYLYSGLQFDFVTNALHIINHCALGQYAWYIMLRVNAKSRSYHATCKCYLKLVPGSRPRFIWQKGGIFFLLTRRLFLQNHGVTRIIHNGMKLFLS